MGMERELTEDAINEEVEECMSSELERPITSKSRTHARSSRASGRLSRHTLTAISRATRSAYEDEERASRILITQLTISDQDDIRSDDGGESLSDSISEGGRLGEEEYETDLEMDIDRWLDEERAELDDDVSGEKRYQAACDSASVVPVSYFVRHIQDQEFAMKHHGLGAQGTRAMCVPLKGNSKIEKLDLEGNWIEEGGCTSIAEMLRDNIYITDLTLSENKTGNLGAMALCEILMKHENIVRLDLSGNEINDSAAEAFCEMLKKNSSLKHLLLSHNFFEEKGAEFFKEALCINESLESLDLSWNRFRTKGAVSIAEGVQENYGLRALNLSMNGLGLDGAEAMGKALKNNRTLLELDVSYNRIPETGSTLMAAGLHTNDTLQSLKIGSNPIGSEGAMLMLTAIDRNDSSALKYFELLNIRVKPDFLELRERLEGERALVVVHGGVLQEVGAQVMRNPSTSTTLDVDAMQKLRTYVRETGYRLIDLFREFDKDANMQISREEFQKGIERAGLDMSEEEVEALIHKLDKNKDGMIDYGELITGDKEYRNTLRQAAEERQQEEAPPSGSRRKPADASSVASSQ